MQVSFALQLRRRKGGKYGRLLHNACPAENATGGRVKALPYEKIRRCQKTAAWPGRGVSDNHPTERQSERSER